MKTFASHLGCLSVLLWFTLPAYSEADRKTGAATAEGILAASAAQNAKKAEQKEQEASAIEAIDPAKAEELREEAEKYRAQAEADGIARQAEELAKNAVTSAGGEPSSASASSEPEVSPANASPAANADPAPATEAKAASDLANLERPTLQENANKILNEQVGPHVTPDETGVTNLERVATQLHEHTLKPENFSGVSPETEALVRTIQEKTEAFTDTYTDNLGKLDSPKPLVRRVANNRAAAKWNESPVQTLFGSYNKTSAAHRGTAAALGAFQKAVLGVTD